MEISNDILNEWKEEFGLDKIMFCVEVGCMPAIKFRKGDFAGTVMIPYDLAVCCPYPKKVLHDQIKKMLEGEKEKERKHIEEP